MKVNFAYERPLAAAPPATRATRAATTAQTDPESQPSPTPAIGANDAAIDAAVEAANQSMRSVATNLQFEKDTVSGRIVVRVIDGETHQVLRQMPSDEMLSMSHALDRLQGLMVRLKV